VGGERSSIRCSTGWEAPKHSLDILLATHTLPAKLHSHAHHLQQYKQHRTHHPQAIVSKQRALEASVSSERQERAAVEREAEAQLLSLTEKFTALLDEQKRTAADLQAAAVSAAVLVVGVVVGGGGGVGRTLQWYGFELLYWCCVCNTNRAPLDTVTTHASLVTLPSTQPNANPTPTHPHTPTQPTPTPPPHNPMTPQVRAAEERVAADAAQHQLAERMERVRALDGVREQVGVRR